MDKKISNKIVGIDLGTTNSCIALKKGSVVEVLENPNSSRTTPSVVASDRSSGEEIVGVRAKNQASLNPEGTIISVKRLMGKEEVTDEIKKRWGDKVGKIDGKVKVKFGGKWVTPEEISSKILHYLLGFAENKLNEKIVKAVITVPAYFNDLQRRATQEAGIIAGLGAGAKSREEALKMINIINEPTAAAMAYGFDKKEDQTILVYDLGGGTFDVTILQITKLESGTVFEVIATSGDDELGGDDFDQVIVDWLVEEFKKEKGIDLSKDKEAVGRLKEASEKAKIELSESLKTDISLPFISADQNGPLHLHKTINRSTFEHKTKYLMEKTIIQVEKALQDAKKKKGKEVKIDEIVLVGGSTRMAMVSKFIKEKWNKEPNKSVNPDEVVAIGAAMQGSILAGETTGVVLLDVTPISLGIETAMKHSKELLMETVIARNTTIPVTKKKIFSTANDGQTGVTIKILQGERAKASDNKVLDSFDLKGIEPKPAGVPQIEVTFEVDTNGILKVSATDLDSKLSKSLEITRDKQGLSEAEVKEIIEKAEKKRAEDEELRSKVWVLNTAHEYCNIYGEKLTKFEAKLKDEPSLTRFKELYGELKKATDEENYLELEKWTGKMVEGKLTGGESKKLEELLKLSQELTEKLPKEEPEKKPEGGSEEKPEKDQDKK